MTALGLPDTIQACLFDLDGVVTRTAVVHAAAWKEMFDAFLRGYEGQRPFDPAAAAPSSAPACGLTVRRTVHSPSGPLLAVTDLA
ncbi:hypothetical protein ACFWIJ_37470, partial [Streptomyces sp. NPDC127079]